MERVYETLKMQITTGALRPGVKLDPVKLACGLNASATPVRDALHRLMAERLVDAWPQEGFHAAMLTEPALRDLYVWSLDVLLAALKSTTGSALPDHHDTEPLPQSGAIGGERARALFCRIVAISGNLEHREALKSVNDRLHLARLFEPRLLPDLDEELSRIEIARRSGELARLRRLLQSYHRQRLQLVPRLSALLRIHAASESAE